jgi:tetratricopeptide (TPR) repeat protein
MAAAKGTRLLTSYVSIAAIDEGSDQMQAQVQQVRHQSARQTCARLIQAAGAGLGFRHVALTALAAGCIAAPGFVYAATTTSAMSGGQERVNKKVEKQVAAAERAVTKAPQDAASRARLGQTYLSAGRFGSAAMTFEDAVSLGDKSPSTALGMALSYIATGRNAEATTLLGQWGETIPVSDHGLALALAGQPTQAITLLGAAIKAGENTVKIRQNLAYAYALSGHLPEARVIASQDVPADKLDVRVSEWALQASVGSQQSRVAALLGAPVRTDPGRPVQLAIATPSASAPALAAIDPTPPAAAADELPALAAAAFAQSVPTASAPQATMSQASYEALTFPESARTDRSVDTTSALQRVAARVEHRRVETAIAPRERKPATPKRTAPGTHLVQLGSFSTEAGARRAWGIFVNRDRSLKDRELRITEATVNGRRYFRVAAAGYQAAEARSKCSTIKGGGSECLAYASNRGLPSSTPSRALAQRLAVR